MLANLTILMTSSPPNVPVPTPSAAAAHGAGRLAAWHIAWTTGRQMVVPTDLPIFAPTRAQCKRKAERDKSGRATPRRPEIHYARSIRTRVTIRRLRPRFFGLGFSRPPAAPSTEAAKPAQPATSRPRPATTTASRLRLSFAQRTPGLDLSLVRWPA